MMTEAEWLTATDPTPMLEFLKEKASDRKLRLFAVACCRSLRHLLFHEDSFKSIEIAEEFADGEALEEDLRKADELAMWAGDDASWKSMESATIAWAACAAVQIEASSAANSAVHDLQRVYADDGQNCCDEQNAQSLLLKDIFGNPFRCIVVDPSWLTSTAVSIAQGIYDDKAFDRLPILADVLQDAGCENADILNHLRSDGPHVKGCWALDLVLSKE